MQNIIGVAIADLGINSYIVGCKYKIFTSSEYLSYGINSYIVGCKFTTMPRSSYTGTSN